ncbi:hypothetical protein IFM89_036203 [Coptis chinensis]|uniref:Filament-like plant protein 7 n=1 Tax=Coptis chinensis TaxID=261450 RepID=A0A835IUU3_9MAGN|nr:hypothetical protein IFM89_036203 [Coptis chinensis]
MDHKAWLWRKKSSEKTIVASDKVNVPSMVHGDETHGADRAVELQKSVDSLNEKLSYVLSECKAKDDLATQHAKAEKEALAGWEKTKAEAVSLRQDLDKALQQRVIAEEQISHLDAALKECMQQLRFVREEQEQRIHDAVMKTSREQEKVQKVLEQKLTETNRRFSKLEAENTHQSTTIQIKEKLIEDMRGRNSQADADLSALKTRLDSMQKDNASMNYELRMLEKELEIRNEEREFNRRSADASHKQHLESVKKIAKLETECQRLRVLVRKRLPGPAALARMKNEVDMLGNQAGTRTRLTPPMGGSMVKDSPQENSPGSPNKKVNYLIERLCDIEEENKTLKEEVSKKTNELESSRIMCTHTASKLSEVEAQLAELSKGNTTTRELPKKISASRRFSSTSESDFNASEDAKSWASSFLPELENARNERPRGPPLYKNAGGSDMSLMDDFVEMEKLAIVCMDTSLGDSNVSSEEANGKELVPVSDNYSGLTYKNQKLQPKDTSVGKYPDWLQKILRMVLEQNRVTLRSPDDIIKDIKVALADMNCMSPGEVDDEKEKLSLSSPSKPPHISGYISWRPPNSSPTENSSDPVSGTRVFSKEISTEQLRSGLNDSICKMIELIEGINQQSLKDFSGEQILSEENENPLPNGNVITSTGYTYRVFQWKSIELSCILQSFGHACNDLLNGKAGIENFARELSLTFEWIMNHCFSLQDVSSMRDTIKKHFDWDESRSESEHGNGMNSFSETGNPQRTNEQSSCLASFVALNAKNPMSQMEEMLSSLNEENRRLKEELNKVGVGKKDLEVSLQSATDRIGALMIELQKAEKGPAYLQTEVETLKASKQMLEDQIESYKLLNEDLSVQLTVVRVELNEVRKKFSSLEVELEEKSNSCFKLETTCLEQQLQLESETKNEQKHDSEQMERQLQNGWEISAASEKLAECQETILNLGKQLKALASPREPVLLDKVVPVTPSTIISNKTHRSSLLDQILAEKDIDPNDLESPKMKEIICTMDTQRTCSNPSDNLYACQAPNKPTKSLNHFTGSNKAMYKSDTAAGILAIVPVQKRGGGISLLRKLLSRRKRESSKKMSHR